MSLQEMVCDSKIDILIWIEDDFRNNNNPDNIYKKLINSWVKNLNYLVNYRESIFKSISSLIDAFIDYQRFVVASGGEFLTAHLASHEMRKQIFSETSIYNVLYDEIERLKDEEILTSLALSVNIHPKYGNIIEAFYDAKKPIFIINETDGIEKYLEKLQSNIELLKDKRILVLIDKNMPGSYDGISCFKYLFEQIRTIKGIELMPIIYSSKIEGTMNLHNIFSKEEDKYAQILKNDLEKEFSNILFYLKVADLFKHQVDSINEVLSKKIFNLSTINYMINSAINEGESPIDHILEWMNVLIRNEMELRQNNDRSLLQKYINAFNPPNTEVPYEDELLEIGNFDIFDNHVNSKYEMISPGDIFYLRGKYYLLVGAPCDIALRKNGTRKLNTIHLLEGEVIDKIATKKINYIQRENDQYVELSNFINNGKNQVIRFKLNGIISVDSRLLDVSSFNEYGKFTNEEKDQIFTIGQQVRFQGIHHFLSNSQNLDKIKHLSEYIVTFDVNYINESHYYEDSARITRVRSQYMIYINQLYSNITSRIGFNTIAMNPYEKVNIKVCSSGNADLGTIDGFMTRKSGQEIRYLRIQKNDLAKILGLSSEVDEEIKFKINEQKQVLGYNFILIDSPCTYLEKRD